MEIVTDESVLILTPTGRDAATTGAVLAEDGIHVVICDDMEALCARLLETPAATVIAEEALGPTDLEQLAATLAQQPAWSDIPFIILATNGRGSLESRLLLAELGAITNATVLERPLRRSTMVSAVKAALRSRRRQYELRDRLIERERMERRLEETMHQQKRIAETLQRCLLEAPPPDAFPNLDVGTQYVPAGNEALVGGDFFDVFGLDDSVALVVGDVVGKGLTAAAQMAEIKFALRAIVRQTPNPARALTQLNRYVMSSEQIARREDPMLVAVLLAIVDMRTGEMSVAAAGAEPPLLVRRGCDAEAIRANGIPIGASDKASYVNAELTMERDDLLVMTTDGITEARRGREFFGSERFMEVSAGIGSSLTASEAGAMIIAKTREFAGEYFRDDVCVLTAKWVGEEAFTGPSFGKSDFLALAGNSRNRSRANETFLARLAARARSSADPDTVLWETVSSLGSFIGVSACYFADIDQATGVATVEKCFTRDKNDMTGAHQLQHFGHLVLQELAAGRTVLVDDTLRDPRTSAFFDQSFARFDLRSFISVPMVKAGELSAVFTVHDSDARHWTGSELDLVEQVAAQTWLVWDNARLVRVARQNVVRQRAFLRDVLMSVTEGRLRLCESEDQLPPRPDRFLGPLPVSLTGGLAQVRHATAAACRIVGMSDDRRYDLETAVSEAAMNAAVHAGGGVGEVFITPEGAVQIRIVDHGAGIADENLPKATLARGFSTTSTLGHGLKMMLQTADRTFLMTGVSGTTVVLEQDPAPRSLEVVW